jgi:hypothetical protein
MPDGISEVDVELIKEVRMIMREIIMYGNLDGGARIKELCSRLSKMIGETYQFETGVALPIGSEE